MGLVSSLSNREKALVGIAVLLDGEGAPRFLGANKERGSMLSSVAEDLALLAPELRMPYVGSMVRQALEEIAKE